MSSFESRSIEHVVKFEKKLEELNESGISVTLSKPPPYLACFMLDEDKNDIIFIFKEERENLATISSNVTVSSKNYSLLNCTTASDDISGQPLEPPVDEFEDLKFDGCNSFFLNNSLKIEHEKCSHFPVPGKVAMLLHNYSNTIVKPEIPVWVLIDKTDVQKSIVLGSYRKNDMCTVSWVTVTEKSKSDVLNIDSMFKRHRSFLQKKEGECSFTEVKCKICVESEGGNILKNVFIHASWKKPSLLIPSRDATLSLELNVSVGDASSPVYFLWQQILLLQKYFIIVAEWKKNNSLFQQRAVITFPNSSEIFNTENVEISIEEKIIDAFMSPQHWSTDCIKSKEPSFEDVLLDIKNGVLPGMDITSRLWMLLSQSSSYKELTAHMQLIFQQAKKCTSTKPFINSNNKTKLAQALRNLLADSSKNMSVWEHGNVEPLGLLVEIGIESLKNYYIATLVQSSIAKERYLDVPNFLSFFAMDDDTWIKTVSSYLIWMSRIHSVVEFVTITRSNIKVTPDIKEIIRRILLHFLGENTTVSSIQHLIDHPNLSFVTSITGYDGQNNGEPMYENWLLRLVSTEKFRTVTNCFLRTSDFIFPDSVFNADIKNETVAALSETGLPMAFLDDQWFLANFTSIVTKVGK